MELKKPEHEFCYEPSIQCPEYSQWSARSVYCDKYTCNLTWNISGHVLKCKECLEDDNNGK